MKELTIGQKAQRYDEILARAKSANLPYYKENIMSKVKEFVDYILPELKDSDDENVRKDMIETIKKESKDFPSSVIAEKSNTWLAWLEKQGEQKPSIIIPKFRVGDTIRIKNSDAEYTITEISDGYYRGKGWCLDIVAGDESGDYELVEQKTTDKVEPEFHEGDWIVHHGTENIYQVVAVIDNQYQLKYGDTYTIQNCVDVDRCARLYDVAKDAKRGDVLSDGTTIFIFKDLLSDGSVMSYCDYDTDSGESDDFCPLSVNLMCSKITIATKEQRELLFQKMKEAGYEWDAEKKELKKIDDKEVNGEDYGIDSLYHAQRILEKTLGSVDGYQSDDGILEHKCAISAVKKLYEQKPVWSEEDEKQARQIERIVHDDGCTQKLQKQISDWFKSLKDRVQPQPKQEWSEDGEAFYNKTIGLLKQYASDNEVRKQSAMSCINWLKSAIKHEKIAKYKIGDRVRFFSHAPIFTITGIDEANERYISQSGDHISFYEELILVKSSINKDNIKCGDYLTTEDGTVIKVHDIDENECVHHFYYASKMTEDGGDISNNFMYYCAILSDCRKSTQEEINFLEKWVAHKKYVWVKNNVSPYDEEED